MSCYKHFSIEERERLLVLIHEKKSLSEISRQMSRHRSTIWRELHRNSTQGKGYSATRAQGNYVQRRRNSVRKSKLSNGKNAHIVVRLLQCYWSPEQISARLKRESNSFQVSTSTVYRSLARKEIDPSCRRYLRIKGRQRCGGRKKSKCGHLNIEYSIHDRPKRVQERKQVGHWESDTVRGAKWSGCVATHVERKSRYVIFCKIPDRSAQAFTDAAIAAFTRLQPGKCKSMTTDHGKEFAQHRRIMDALDCKVYFADPSAPWQRGTNENTSGLLRQFLPKRTSFTHLTQ